MNSKITLPKTEWDILYKVAVRTYLATGLSAINIWRVLKKKVKQCKFQSKEELRAIMDIEWKRISQEKINSYIMEKGYYQILGQQKKKNSRGRFKQGKQSKD